MRSNHGRRYGIFIFLLLTSLLFSCRIDVDEPAPKQKNSSPVLHHPSDTTIAISQTLHITLSAADPNGDALTYSMRNAPSGASLSGNVFTWTPAANQAAAYLVDFIVTEQTTELLRDSATVRITVHGDDTVTATGLVAYWPFSGNANDASDNGNNGIVSEAALTTDRFGNANSAYNFDGIDDYIRVQNSSSLDITGSITISMWIWFDTAAVPAGSKLLYKAAPGGPDGYEISDFSASAQYASTDIYKPSFAIGTGAFHGLETPDYFQKRVWTHFTGVYDGSKISIYVNGVLVKESNLSGAIVSTSRDLYIGNHDITVANQPFKGKLDDIRIYNRALSLAEIQLLANEGR